MIFGLSLMRRAAEEDGRDAIRRGERPLRQAHRLHLLDRWIVMPDQTAIA